MPKVRYGKRQETKQNAPRFNQREFVNYELEKEQRVDMKKSFLPRFEFADAILKLVEEGYTVTLRYDSWSESPACWLQTWDDSHENFEKILAGRGATPLSALIEACYKHWVCFEGSWPSRADKQKPKAWDEIED